jgi:E3 ubiquitin-protein ligase ATL23
LIFMIISSCKAEVEISTAEASFNTEIVGWEVWFWRAMIERMLLAVAMSMLLLCAGMGMGVAVYLWLVWYVSLHNRPRQRASEDNGKPHKHQGLSEADLQRLPTIECQEEESHAGDGGGGDAECAVCLEVFQSGDRCRVIPACSHAFHVHCADAWLSKRSVCPICRRSAACESEKKKGVNCGAAAALQEEDGRDHEDSERRPPPSAEHIVVDMPITPTDYRG